jgi:hypothetical protein
MGIMLGSVVKLYNTIMMALSRNRLAAFFISLLGQQEVDGIAFFVNSPIEIMPYALDLDIRFIYPPVCFSSSLPLHKRFTIYSITVEIFLTEISGKELRGCQW